MIKYKNKKNHIHIPYNQRKNNVNIDTYLSDDLYYVENKYNENLNVFADLFTGLELNNYERLLLKKRLSMICLIIKLEKILVCQVLKLHMIVIIYIKK